MMKHYREEARDDFESIFGDPPDANTARNPKPFPPDVHIRDRKLAKVLGRAVEWVELINLMDAIIRDRVPGSQFEPTPRSKEWPRNDGHTKDEQDD